MAEQVLHKAFQQEGAQFDAVKFTAQDEETDPRAGVDVGGAFEIARHLENVKGGIEGHVFHVVGFHEKFGVELKGISPACPLFDLEKIPEVAVHLLHVFALREVFLDFPLEACQCSPAVKQHGIRLFAVPSGTPRLLEISLRTLGDVEVEHQAHVGLVDAHAESVGGDHHRDVTRFPGVLPDTTLMGR